MSLWGELIMDMALRRQAMFANDEKLIYIGRNLVCNGSSSYYDTGFYPFYGESANVDFKITMRMSSYTWVGQSVAIGCKYEGTTGGQQWPGFYVRSWSSNQANLEIGGYNYWHPAINDVLNKNLYIWRTNGNWFAQIEGGTVQNLSVRVAEFNQPIIIGAGVQTNGSKFRYCNCVIDYIRIEYL